MGFDRGNFFSALTGLIVGVVLVAVLPAGADDGDPIYLGQANTAKATTRISVNWGMVVRSFRAGVPAATFKVSSGAPIAVSSSGLVTDLNADLLDGMEASEFAGSIEVDERLSIGESTVLATVTGATLTFACTDDGGGGSTATVTVEATAPDLHLVIRDETTIAASAIYGWGAHNSLATSATAAVTGWDPDMTRQEYLDAWINAPRRPFTIWSPSGGLIEGMLMGLLSDAAPEDCVLTGFLIATG